jgi:hypothetical protein
MFTNREIENLGCLIVSLRTIPDFEDPDEEKPIGYYDDIYKMANGDHILLPETPSDECKANEINPNSNMIAKEDLVILYTLATKWFNSLKKFDDWMKNDTLINLISKIKSNIKEK